MAVVTKTAAEVSAGTMGPRRALEELVVLHGQYANFCQRFGIKQGIDSSGKIKYRCIDNHATSGVNDAASRMQKILMSNIASIMLLIVRYESILRKAGLLGPEWSLVGATEDLKAAYRQRPLSDSMLSLCLVCFITQALVLSTATNPLVCPLERATLCLTSAEWRSSAQ